MAKSIKLTIPIGLTAFVIFCSFVFCLPQAFCAEADFKQGVSLFKKQKYSLAIEKFDKVIKENRGDYRACYFLGRCCESLGNKKRAAKMYRNAIVYGYKTKVAARAAQYLEQIDKTRYVLAVGEGKKRFEARQARAKALLKSKSSTKNGGKSPAKNQGK